MKKRRKMLAKPYCNAKYIIFGGEIFKNLAAPENAPILARFIWKPDCPAPNPLERLPVLPPQS